MSLAALGYRLVQKDDRHSWRTHVAMVRGVRRWEKHIARHAPSPGTGPVTAYVANFRRPQNIEPIVRSLLASSSVGRIIVSNNNPDCALERWLRVASERVRILRHHEPQDCFMRYVHLRPFASQQYLIIDDDVFLQPAQIDGLNARLHDDPSVPHGVYGQRWNGSGFVGGVQQTDGRIDVISRVYAFTDRHMDRVFRLADEIGAMEGYEGWGCSLFDDILLSFSGDDRPRMHDLGPLLDCPTQGRKGVANWREDGFHRGREIAFLRLRDRVPLAHA